MKQSKKKLISLIAFSSVVVLAVTAVTYSWFNSYLEPSASNINLGVVNDFNDIKIAFEEDSDFTYHLVDKYNYDKFGQVSGDGLNFYTCEFKSKEVEGKMIYDVSGYKSISRYEYSDYFYFRKIKIKSDKKASLYLSTKSYIDPADPTQRLNYNFSKDYVAGAMRMSVASVNEDSTRTRQVIWAPHSTYELTTGGRRPIFDTEGTVESSYSLVEGTKLENVMSIPTYLQESGQETIASKDEMLYCWGDQVSHMYIMEIEPGVTHFEVAIWLEGTDRECNLYLSGGQVKAKICFFGEVAIH